MSYLIWLEAGTLTINWRIKLYNYSLIAPFDIICQQEVNWIDNYVPKAQQVTCDRDTRKSYISIRNRYFYVDCWSCREIPSARHLNLVLLTPHFVSIWAKARAKVDTCLTPHSTIFQLYRGSQFYWWKKLEKTSCRKSMTNKTTICLFELSQVFDR
jgi:hypothetical protein